MDPPGFELEWVDGVPPPPSRRPNGPSCFEPAENAAFLSDAVRKVVASGAARAVSEQPLIIVSPLGVAVHPRTAKRRMYFACCELNEHLVHHGFSYEGVTDLAAMYDLGDDVVPISMDISSAYHHIDVKRDQWTFLGFEWDGQFYEWCCLPFGVASACWAFTKVSRVLLRHWRATGIPCVGMMDDWMGLVKRPAHAWAAWRMVRDAESCGWVVNRDKCVGVDAPVSEVDWLGHHLDFARNRLSMMDVHVADLLARGRHLLDKASARPSGSTQWVRAANVWKFTGKVSSFWLVSGGEVRLFTFHLHRCVAGVFSRNKYVKFTAEASREVEYWLRRFSEPVSTELHPREPVPARFCMWSDAGAGGWGGHAELRT